MTWEQALDILLDALIDTAKVIPFLLIAYLAMEFLEHKASEKMENTLGKIGKAGPLVGSALGIIPQCGFSATASNLYTAGVITEGTLLSIYLTTSDEALPILISTPSAHTSIWKILLCKVCVGIVAGFIIDFIYRRLKVTKVPVDQCENCGCNEEGGGIIKPAIIHTLKITIFVLIVNLGLGYAIGFLGHERLSEFMLNGSYAQPFITAFIGLVPNCAISVLLTELYVSGALSLGSCVAGLCSGAGIGLAVLLKTNKSKKENIRIIIILYSVSAIFGFLLMLFGAK